jgi:hypothetical protein
MSRRNAASNASQLQKELADLKATASQASVKTNVNEAPNFEAANTAFEDLSPVEKSAASLGVNPDALKPISWLNEGHHQALLRANALDGNLARRIEVRLAPLSLRQACSERAVCLRRPSALSRAAARQPRHNL